MLVYEREILCIFTTVFLKPKVTETVIVIEDTDAGIGRVRTHISDSAGSHQILSEQQGRIYHLSLCSRMEMHR
jgi:hypothetical protein